MIKTAALSDVMCPKVLSKSKLYELILNTHGSYRPGLLIISNDLSRKYRGFLPSHE